MKNKTTNEEGIILNIYHDDFNDDNAWLKILTENKMLYLKVKGFWKTKNKNNNVSIGSYCNFEFFEHYGSSQKKILKKVKTIFFFNKENMFNKVLIERLFWVFQLIKASNKEIIHDYLLFIQNQNDESKIWFLTYFFNKILVLQNQVNKMNYCIKCNSNKDIYAINFFEGVICFNDFQTKKNLTEWVVDSKLIKGFYYLNVSLETYIKNTNTKTNQKIFLILENLFKYLN